MKSTNKLWFTLVELIVVITILAILWTIAFISLQWYSSQARDSKRISEISSIDKLLSIYLVKVWHISKPENSIKITASWELIWYQWVVWEDLLSLLWMSKWWKDPLDDKYYVYRTNEILTEYQILWFLENWNDLSFSELVKNTEARDYEEDKIYTKWDELWVLLDWETNVPANQVWFDVDLVNTEIEYKNVFESNDIITWTWETLKLSILWWWLVWYWDFEEIEWDWFIDKSWNDIVSTMTGWVTLTWWINWNWIYLDWTWNTSVTFNSLPNLWVEANNAHTISAWVNIDEFEDCLTDTSCRQWLLLLWQSWPWSHHWLIWWYSWPTQLWIWSSVSYWWQLKPNINMWEWQHIVIVFDWMNLIWYINWLRIGSKNVFEWADYPMNIKNANLLIWKKMPTAEKNYKWYIDELGVYNKALSAQEVQLLYTINWNY